MNRGTGAGKRIGWNMSADFSELRVKMVDGQVRTTDVTSAPLLGRHAFRAARRFS